MGQFDGAAYWKQAFEKSEKAQARLLDRIHELEQPTASAASYMKSTDVGAIDKGKRKRENSTSIQKANSQVKRKATSTRGVQKTVESLADPISMTTFPMTASNAKSARESSSQGIQLRLTRVESRFLRHFFDTRSSIRDSDYQPENVATSVSSLCNAAREVVYDIVHRSLTALSNPKSEAASQIPQEELQDSSQVLQNGFFAIVEAMKKFEDCTTSGSSVETISISSLELLVYVLDEIHGTCALFAEHTVNIEARTLRPSTAKKRGPNMKETERNMTRFTVARWLTDLLHAFVHCMDDKSAVRSGLFEGYCCALLDRVGTILSIKAFADDIDAVPTSPHPKVDQPTSLKDAFSNQSSLKTRSPQVEGRLILHLLEQILEITTRYQTLMTAQSPPIFGLRKDPSLTTRAFMDNVKKKLQVSLLKGVFGHEDLTFRDSLSMPASPIAKGLLTSFENLSSPNDPFESPDWFLQQVWRLIGWEILSGLYPVQSS